MGEAFTPDEFDALMQSWDEKIRVIAQRRLQRNEVELKEFSAHEARILKGIVNGLIPQAEDIDLVAFLDWAAPLPLGRGDRRAGMPAEPELYHYGLDAVEKMSRVFFGKEFLQLNSAEIDVLIDDMMAGSSRSDIWVKVPSEHFIKALYRKSLHGYFSHPRAWMRIGFMGAAYPEGYAWLNRDGVRQRRARAPGWETM